MKKLVIPALLLAALQATGCIFVSDDDGDTATINVSWELFSGSAAVECPVGATTIAVNAQLGSGTPYVDLFDCSGAGSGFADDLPLGTYQVWVDVTDSTGSALYAQSEAAEITLDSPGEFAQAAFDIDVDNGFWDVSWNIIGVNGNGCAAVNQNGVGVLSTLAGTTTGRDDKFNCVDGEDPNFVTTPPIPIGDYTVILSLLEPGTDASLGDSLAITPSIDYGNQFVDLGTITIEEGVYPNP